MSETMQLGIIFLVCGLVMLWAAYAGYTVWSRKRYIERLAQQRRNELRRKLLDEEMVRRARLARYNSQKPKQPNPGPRAKPQGPKIHESSRRRHYDDDYDSRTGKWYSATPDVSASPIWSGGGGSSGGAGASGSWDSGSSSSSSDGGGSGGGGDS